MMDYVKVNKFYFMFLFHFEHYNFHYTHTHTWRMQVLLIPFYRKHRSTRYSPDNQVGYLYYTCPKFTLKNC